MQYNFTKQQKLLEADDFSSVFILRKLIRAEYVNIYYKKNDLGYSRLGFIVSKKIHKRAVKRNYMKRALREYFRQNEVRDIGFDIIIKVVKLYQKDQFQNVTLELDILITRVLKYYARDQAKLQISNSENNVN